MSELDQNSKPFIAAGGYALPVMRVRTGKSFNQAVTTTPGAATAITVDGCSRIIRIFAIGCPLYYITGATGVGVPGTTNGYVPQDLFIDEIIDEAPNNYIRVVAASGTGTARVQVMG